jgi:hypothetical protein
MPGELDKVKKAQKHEQAFEAPVYEKGYPSYEAVNRKEDKKPLDAELREKGLI